MDKLGAIKQDLLNEIEREKYYISDEIQRLCDTDNISHKEKVFQILELIKELSTLTGAHTLTNNIFVTNETSKPEQNAPVYTESNNTNHPDNIIQG